MTFPRSMSPGVPRERPFGRVQPTHWVGQRVPLLHGESLAKPDSTPNIQGSGQMDEPFGASSASHCWYLAQHEGVMPPLVP